MPCPKLFKTNISSSRSHPCIRLWLINSSNYSKIAHEAYHPVFSRSKCCKMQHLQLRKDKVLVVTWMVNNTRALVTLQTLTWRNHQSPSLNTRHPQACNKTLSLNSSKGLARCLRGLKHRLNRSQQAVSPLLRVLIQVASSLRTPSRTWSLTMDQHRDLTSSNNNNLSTKVMFNKLLSRRTCWTPSEMDLSSKKL